MGDKPRRRCEVAILIGADTAKDVCAALTAIEFMYSSEGMGRNVVSGGMNFGYICVDNEDPQQTHEAYFKAVDEWIAARKAEIDQGRA